MVLRRASDYLTYPPSPHPALSNALAWPNSTDHLDVNSTDIPPVPSHPSREAPKVPSQPIAFADAGNPWLEQSQRWQDDPNPPPAQPQQVDTRAQSPFDHRIPMTSDTQQQDNHTPRSSTDSENSRNFWEDDEEAQHDHEVSSRRSPHLQDNSIAGTSAIKRKPVGGSPQVQAPYERPASPDKLNSNNPYRHETSAERTNSPYQYDFPQWGSEASQAVHKGKEPVRNQPFVQDTYDYPASSDHVSAPWEGGVGDDNPLFAGHRTEQPPQPTSPPPPIPGHTFHNTIQPPLLPTSTEHENSLNPWTSEAATAATSLSAPLSPAPAPPIARYNASLLDRGQENGVVSLENELAALPNAVELDSREPRDLIDFGRDDPVRTDYFTRESQPRDHSPFRASARNGTEHYEPPEGPPPAKPPRPPTSSVGGQQGNETQLLEGSPPTKPPRPALVVNSDAALAKMIEQRNETYQIKHFNWFDHQSGQLRTSSMLTQNENGPCPLLALVNALILGIREDSQAALDNALRTREQVTLGLIIETLMDELLSVGGQDLPDVDELNRFLTRLHTGMNANPRFVSPPEGASSLMGAHRSMLNVPQTQRPEKAPGSFEATQDIRLYGSFAVPLIHGWLPAPKDPAKKAFARSAQTYEDAQAIQFGEEELEYRLSNGGLSNEEQNVWQDIMAIKQFLRQYPTQLTPHGLEVVTEWLLPGQFAILFRNDHFSTIYKHPGSGKLFTLITDAGYAERDEIIWESLNDHSGSSEFFSGDFMSISHSGESQAESGQGPPQRSQHLAPPSDGDNGPLSPQEQQEQHDADFAMALQLQEEEEQRMAGNRTRSGGNNPPRGQGIPIPLRQRSGLPEVRPVIPPRATRSQNNAVNRSAELDAQDAPPAYEEAAKGKPYNPPLGSPHHPSADPSPRNSTTQLSQTLSAASTAAAPPDSSSSGPLPRRQQQRRSSAYGENALRFGPASPSVSRPVGHAYGVGAGSGSGFAEAYGPAGRYPRRKGDAAGDRDCVVM